MASIKIKKKKRKPFNKQTRVPVFPVVIAVVIVCCVISGIRGYQVAYSKMITKLAQTAEDDGETQYSPNEIIEQARENLIGADIDGVIKEIDYTTGDVTFLNLKANESIALTATDDTVYPGTSNLDDYMIGDVVTYVYDKDNHITDIKNCANAWSVSDVGLEVSKTAKRLTFGSKAINLEGKSYSYSDMCTVRYKKNYSKLESIDPSDFVTIQGYDTGTTNKAYSITIEKSHGEIRFINYANIESPKLTLNGKTTDITKDGVLKITEGTHSIEITSPTCETYTKEVIILPKETCIVDLSAMQIKSGVLNIAANVVDYKLFIDDQEYSISEPILLPYGKYKLKITKDDYNDYSSTITIDQDVNTVNVTMKEREKLGTVNTTASPEGTRIYIDGSYIGTAPIRYGVPLGTHTIEARIDGYISESKSVVINNEGDTVDCNFDLTPVVSRYVETE